MPATQWKEKSSTAQRIAAALRRHGVDLIFAQSLPSALILATEQIGIRQIVYRTENAGGAMADGYARRSNKVAVVAAQNGPAATLLVPPLAEALKASIPVVALVQEVSRGHEDRNAFQSLDHLRLFESCTKWVRCLPSADRVEDYIDMAFTAAATGRPGPAAVMLPANALIETPAPAPYARNASLGRWPLDRVLADPGRITEAARLLARAESPLVIAGGGVHGSGASDALARLQEQACLPVASTMMGKGCFSDVHTLSAGLSGNVMGERSLGHYTRPLLEQADVILLVGTRTNQNGTDSWSLYPKNASIIHLDVDAQEVGRTYEALRLVGDARLTLLALTDALLNEDLTKRRQSRARVEEQIARARRERDKATLQLRTSNARPIRPERIMEEVGAVLTPQTTVVADASYSSVWITSYLQASSAGQRFLTPRGLAGLGWGFPLAIGAKLAEPQHPVICIVGDGAFAHCWSELETARRMNIGVVLIVLNNSVLGYQKDAEHVKFGQYTTACHFTQTDHAAIARACGIEAHRVEDPARIETLLRDAVQRRDTTLLDIVTDPNAYPPLTMFDGTLIS